MSNKQEVYFWIDRSSNFGGGKDAVVYGEEMPKGLAQAQIDTYLKAGWISTQKTVTERQLSELEMLREKVKNQGEGSGISQADLDAAKGESVQSDLDRIAELEANAGGDAADTLELIKEALSNIQAGDSKAEIWEATKSVKDLLNTEAK